MNTQYDILYRKIPGLKKPGDISDKLMSEEVRALSTLLTDCGFGDSAMSAFILLRLLELHGEVFGQTAEQVLANDVTGIEKSKVFQERKT